MLGTLKIVYHPSSRREPEVISIQEYILRRSQVLEGCKGNKLFDNQCHLLHTAMREASFEIPYEGKLRTTTFQYRSLWEWSEWILKHPAVGYSQWDAYKIYHYDPEVEQYMRMIDEPYTADRAWEIQVRISSGMDFMLNVPAPIFSLIFRKKGNLYLSRLLLEEEN